VLKAYNSYKEWWMGSQDTYRSSDENFEDHINRMGVFELMETLLNWSDNEL
jgi:hypothetical protein